MSHYQDTFKQFQVEYFIPLVLVPSPQKKDLNLKTTNIKNIISLMAPAKRISLPPTTRAPQLQQPLFITMINAFVDSSSGSSPLWPYQPRTPLETRGFHPSNHIA